MPPLPAQGLLFCTSECLKAPVDLLKIYLHESNRVYRDKLLEEQDFRLFDKLQADTVKKFYEVRVSQSSAEEDKSGRLEDGGGIIRLPALCLRPDISGQRSEERRKGMLGEHINQRGMGVCCQVGCQPGKLENILMVFCPLLPHMHPLPHMHSLYHMHTRHLAVKNLTSVCTHTHTHRRENRSAHAQHPHSSGKPLTLGPGTSEPHAASLLFGFLHANKVILIINM